MNKIRQWKNEYGIRDMCVLLFLFTGMVLIRVYRLDSIPCGVNVDEMGMGYDAWCLANFGVDRYLNSFPLYFINFCAGQSVLYGYLCTVFVKFFGLSVWTIRIPGVVFSLLTVVYGVKLVVLKWGKGIEYILLFMALFTALPVFLFLSRIGLDCNLMLGMMTVFLYYFCLAIEKQKNSLFLVSGILAGITLYSYILSYLMLPAFLVCMLGYVIYLKKIQVKQVVIFAVPLMFLGLPLLVIQLIQILDMETMRIGIFTLPKLYQYRGNELSLQVFGENLKGIWKAVFLYDGMSSDSVPRFGNLYYISLPFIIAGVVHMGRQIWSSFRKKEWSLAFPILIWFVVEVLVGCCTSEKAIWLYRYNAAYISILFFLIEGICCSGRWLGKRSNKLGTGYGIALGSIYAVLFVCFIRYYFVEYTKEYPKIEFFNHTFNEAVDYLEEIDALEGRNTYIGNLDQTYIYYLGGEQISPYEYNRIEVEDSEHLWQWANSYGQYQFYLPDEIEMNANYIVDRWNTEYGQRLETTGFQKETAGAYEVYCSPLAEYRTGQLTGGYGWDAGISSENIWDVSAGASEIDGVLSQVVVGWCVNEENGKLWDEVYLTVGSDSYYPQQVEREDIAEKYGTEELLQSGLLFIIPREALTEHTVTLNCIDNEQKERVCLEITVTGQEQE